MRMQDPYGLESEDMLRQRFVKLIEYLRSIDEGAVVVLICHSEVIWWLTSQVVVRNPDDGETRYGKWTQNGEVLDITQFIFMSNNQDETTQHTGDVGRLDLDGMHTLSKVSVLP